MGQASSFTDLLEFVLQDVPGCSRALALQHLQQAARYFCIETEAWQEKLAAIDLKDATTSYTLTTDYEAEFRRIVTVWIRTETDVTNGDEGTVQDFDKYTFTPAATLELDDSIEPQEDVTDGLVVKVVLVPYLNTDVGTVQVEAGISPTFLNLWAEAIIARAKHTLFIMPRKLWSDPGLAAYWLNEYRKGVSAAKTETEGLQYRSEQDGIGA
jgi:hypothetical protein